MMNFGKSALRGAAFAFAIFAVPMAIVPYAGQAFADNTVKIVVNKTPITNDDISKRVAFLKLQRQSGNLNEKAREQLVDEALKREEIARVKMSVSTEDVDAAFARFAGNNKMSPQQLTKVLAQAGVGDDALRHGPGVRRGDDVDDARRHARVLQDLREERVGDIRHRDQDLAAALGLERAGDRVGHVAQCRGGLLDARARGRQHFVRPRKCTRHGAGGDADVLCDVVDGGHGVSSPVCCAVHNRSCVSPC